MTIEEAAERLKELPGEWWWKVCLCHVSADATIAPDYAPSDEARAFDERFNRHGDRLNAILAGVGQNARLLLRWFELLLRLVLRWLLDASPLRTRPA